MKTRDRPRVFTGSTEKNAKAQGRKGARKTLYTMAVRGDRSSTKDSRPEARTMNRLSVLLSLSLSLSAWILLGFSGQIAQLQTKTGIEYPYATAEPNRHHDQASVQPTRISSVQCVIGSSALVRRKRRFCRRSGPAIRPTFRPTIGQSAVG